MNLRIKEGGTVVKKANRVLGIVVISIIFFLLTVERAIADKIILDNGDSLTGTIEKMTDGKLTLKTDYAGNIEIQIGKSVTDYFRQSFSRPPHEW